MPHQKHHHSHASQLVGEPAPGSIIVGYVRYRNAAQEVYILPIQQRVITEFAQKKGWVIADWYEEPAHSAKYEAAEKRPVFTQLLKDADARKFQGVICYDKKRWARSTALASASLSQLCKAGIWWATADGSCDLHKVQQEGIERGYAFDTQMSEMSIRQLCERTRRGPHVRPYTRGVDLKSFPLK